MALDSAGTTPESMPTGDGQTVVFGVVKDFCNRSADGAKKYGTLLKTDNGRDALVDAYQEALDLTMYLKQALMEKEARGKEKYIVRVDKVESTISLYIDKGNNNLVRVGRHDCKQGFKSTKSTAFEMTFTRKE